MTENILSAAANPDAANDLINQALKATENKEKQEVKVRTPADNLVHLPGGYIDADGGVISTVEVRELTGKDEEAISRATSVGRILQTVLSRGTVKVGDLPATEEVLNKMLAGDREAVLLGIHKVTFGNPLEVNGWCDTCEEVKDVLISLDEDIEMKKLEDPIADRTFKVQGKSHEYTVVLPNGTVQKELQLSLEKTGAELSSILLQSTVTEIDGELVYSKAAIQNMSLADRRKVSAEIVKRNPGPVFKDIVVECPDCGKEVVIPINLGSLFQF